ncbi:MAG: 50S ribosomal protein L25 [bacterium]
MSELEVQKRIVLGTRQCVQLRKKGIAPAELYGHGVENMHLSVESRVFEKIYREAGRNTVVSLKVDKEKYPVLIENVQRHSISGDIISIDFYKVKMDEKIQTAVPIVFIGVAPAIEQGGILVKTLQEIEIEALPDKLPHEITIDLSILKEIGESIYVKDLRMDNQYEVITDGETVIASIAEQEEEKQEESINPDQVIVESEEKKASRAKTAEE